MKNWVKCIAAVLIAVLLLAMPVSAGSRPVEEEPMFESYIYAMLEGKIQALKSPAPYRVEAQVDAATLGVDMKTPADVCVFKDSIYIVDSSLNHVIHTDKKFDVIRTIKSFQWNGKEETFSAPEGVSVTDDTIYIADTGNKRIVALNNDGTCRAVITRPEDDMVAEDLDFAPRKVAADGKGRVYAVVKGVYEGIMELYEDGTFSGYVGSIPVKADPWTLIWKNLMSKEQREKLEKFIPVEYTNLTTDSDGFIYTVSLASDEVDSIRRLNATGGDILNRGSLGSIPVSGVVNGSFASGSAVNSNKSDFVDIAVDEEGIYYGLDAEYGRVFAYDEFGNMLFVFGGRSTGQTGTFPRASAIALLDGQVVVADSITGTITIFSRTAYAEQIALGIQLYNDDKYEESIVCWNNVLQYNRHFVLAYSKMGQAYYQLEEYDLASEYFVKSNDQANYTKSFSRQRDAWFNKNFTWVVLGAIGAILLLVIIKRVIKAITKRHPIQPDSKLGCLKYAFYVILHPFDGFWDLKYEKRGRTWVATLFVVLTIVAFAMERSLSGFAIASVPDRHLDIIHELKFVLVPLALFLVGNLSITTLMEGKGNLIQTYNAVGYCLLPLILVKIPVTIISNMLTADEMMYVTLFNTLAIVWVAMLLFCALMNTHEYTAGKTVGTVIITAVAMVIICFICVLFFSLFSELIGFVYTVIQELQYR